MKYMHNNQNMIPPAKLQRYLWGSFLWVLLPLFWALWGLKKDYEQGEIYRLLFLHVPSAWNAFLWFLVGACFSLVFLWKVSQKTPIFRLQSLVYWFWSANCIGTLFSALTLMTGSLWARYTWGVWWYWDARLTTTLVLFLLGSVFHILDRLIPELSIRYIVTAIILFLNAINVPLVYVSVWLWRSIHQTPTFFRPEQKQLVSQDIFYTLMVSTITLSFFGGVLIWGLTHILKLSSQTDTVSKDVRIILEEQS